MGDLKQIPYQLLKAKVLNKSNWALILIDYGKEYCILAKNKITAHELECVVDKYPTDTTDLDDFNANLLSKCDIDDTLTVTTDALPFAQPTYRTKRAATSGLLSVPANSSAGVAIVYKLLTEKYVSGGSLIVENAELGDYIVATVVDYDGVIPEAYRAALCEAWPIVATYIEKEFVEIGVPGTLQAGAISRHTIDTTPLNAKITAGLYLTVRYYSVATGLTRRMGVNYLLTKKL